MLAKVVLAVAKVAPAPTVSVKESGETLWRDRSSGEFNALKIFRLLTPQQRQNLFVLFLAGLGFWASLATLLPTLPLYIEGVLSGTPQQVGIVMGSFAIGLMVSRPWLGRLSDRRGRKVVLLIGAAVVAIAPLGYLALGYLSGNLMVSSVSLEAQALWSPVTRPIPVMMLMRAFHGVSIAAFATSYIALVADVAPHQNRGELLAYMSLVNPLGLVFGPAIGGIILDNAGYAALFLVAGGLGGLGWISILWIHSIPDAAEVLPNHGGQPIAAKKKGPDQAPAHLEKTVNLSTSKRLDIAAKETEGRPMGAGQLANASRQPKQGKIIPYWRLLIGPSLGIPALILLSVGLVFGTVGSFLPLFIKESELTINAGLFYTTAAIAGLIVRIFLGRLSDRYGRGRLITVGLLFYGTSMVVLWTANAATDVILAGVVEGVGFGLLLPSVSALIADRCRAQERGRIFGICLLGFDLGLAIAGPILGSIAQTGNYRQLFAIAATLAFLATFIFMTQSSKNLHHSLKFSLGQGRDVYALED